jgi:GT2 family glycosyltransferase
MKRVYRPGNREGELEMQSERVGGALTSVVMVCCGQLEHTMLSVPRLLRFSRLPVELLFVDAGSLDGTVHYLSGVVAAASVRVELFRGERDGDLPALVAQTLARAEGEFIAWLNNDVLVTELWLQQLHALLTSNDVIGVAGPVANLAPEPQRIAGIPYRLARPLMKGALPSTEDAGLDTRAVDRFAHEHRQTNKGHWCELDRVGGFCWLARRSVLEQIELFKKGGDRAVFDADQMSLRVRQAGYRLCCCRDLYVHHFGANLQGA